MVAGLAVAALALGAAAMSRLGPVHVTTIRYSDGAVERIVQAGAAQPMSVARLQAFADMQRLSAEMDREAELMLRQTAPGVQMAQLGGGLPVAITAGPGVRGYSVVTTVTGGHVCTRTTEYGPAVGKDGARTLTRVSGDCGRAEGGAAPPRPSAPGPRLPVA